MATKLSPSEEKQLLLWLQTQGRTFSASLNQLLGMSFAIFALRIATVWLLSQVLHQIIILSQAPQHSSLLYLALCFVSQAALIAIKGYAASRAEQRISEHYQQQIYQQLQRFHLALLRQQPVSHWQAHFMRRSPALSQFYLDFQLQKRLASIVPLFVIAVVLSINWLVALVLLVAAPLIPIFMWLTGVGAANAHREHFVAIDRLNHLFLDRLRGRRLLQLFDRTTAEQRSFNTAGIELKERTLKVVRLAFLSASVLDFFSTIAMALVAILVGFNLLTEISIGHWQSPLNFQQGLFLLLMTPLFFAELKLLGRFYHTKSEAIGAAAEIRPLIEMQMSTQTHPCDLGQHSLQWPALTLCDQQQQPLLQVPACHLAMNDKVLLTGPSGSGKSLLLEALLGLRAVTPLTGSLPTLAHSQIAWLGQSSTLLPSSIRENLTLNEPFTDQQLWQVLEQVELTLWVKEQPAQLEQLMGENPPLSGGQAQRLALARILLFNQPIVLLDEPTAHLADEQHQLLSVLLQQQLAEKTVIWVSHRELPTHWFNQQWQVSSETSPAQVRVAQHPTSGVSQ